MAVSIREAQSRLMSSGVLNNLGSTAKGNELPYDSVIEEITQLWADKEFIPTVRKSILRNKLTASSDLLQSIAPDVVVRGNNIVRFKLMMAPHWEYAEHGRRRGKRPPIKAIEKWITDNGIQVRQDKGQSKLSVIQRRRQMARGIAAAIGRKGTIKRFGYKGSNFLSDVTPDQMRILGDLLSKALGYTVILDLKSAFRRK